MSAIITADLHLTDNPRDEHRWGLFAWLKEKIEKYKVKEVLILGDLTDAKDRHSAKLTNRLAKELRELAMDVHIYALRGNHDYIDPTEPFFGFVEYLEAEHPVYFITSPINERMSIGRTLLLPNTRHYEKDWADAEFKDVDFIFTHQTYSGCLTENGTQLEGVPPSIFPKGSQVISGDIHVPQKVGPVEYVGAPYRIRFGDKFDPRVLLIRDDGSRVNLRFPTISKHVIEIEDAADLERYDIGSGDQVKIRVRLSRQAFGQWPEIRQACLAYASKHGWQAFGPELLAEPMARTAPKHGKIPPPSGSRPAQAVEAYASQRGLSSALKSAGLKLLTKALGEQ